MGSIRFVYWLVGQSLPADRMHPGAHNEDGVNFPPAIDKQKRAVLLETPCRAASPIVRERALSTTRRNQATTRMRFHSDPDERDSWKIQEIAADPTRIGHMIENSPGTP